MNELVHDEINYSGWLCHQAVQSLPHGFQIKDQELSLQCIFKPLKWTMNRYCILVFKCLRGLAPDYLAKKFKKRSEIHNKDIRTRIRWTSQGTEWRQVEADHHDFKIHKLLWQLLLNK